MPSHVIFFVGLISGENILDFERSEWVAALTAVSQEPVLFSGGWSELRHAGLAHRCHAQQRLTMTLPDYLWM
jgi:hypothetical protein